MAGDWPGLAFGSVTLTPSTTGSSRTGGNEGQAGERLEAFAKHPDGVYYPAVPFVRKASFLLGLLYRTLGKNCPQGRAGPRLEV